MHDCFKGIPKELLAYIPNLKYHLTSVHDLSDANILALDDKGLLRSLFLAYTYTERKDVVKDLLIEVFKFFHHFPDGFKFFQIFLDFVANEAYLSPDEREEVINYYLSPQQKKGVMNTYQALRQEGRQEGNRERARLVVLRGRFMGASVDFLAKQSELPYIEVQNMHKSYDEVYQFWATKRADPKAIIEVAHLSEDEVRYLIGLFNEKLN